MTYKTGITIGTLCAVLGGIWYFNTRHYVPKNSDEFFRRNPHLQRPISRMKPIADQLRENDQFKEGDYQLQANHVYPVEFTDSVIFAQANQPQQQFESQGKVLLKSLGLMGGRLVILAEFQFNKMKEMKKLSTSVLEEYGILKSEKQTPTPNQLLKRSILVKLDPRGIVREVYVADPKVAQLSLESRLKVLDQIFKPVSSLKPGTIATTEIDDRGYPYPMNYTIQDEGETLRIKANSSLNYGMNETESKAAAVGAQGFGMLAMVGNQKALMDWQWLKSEQRPKVQSFQGGTELKIQNQLIAQMSGTSNVLWGDRKVDATIRSTASKFTHPISVQLLRANIRAQQQKNLNEKSPKKDLKKVQPQLTAKEKHQKAFQNLTEELKNNPHKIPAFEQMAMVAPANSESLSMTLGALGYEGSEESQKALMNVYSRDDLTGRDREKIMTELILVDQALSNDVKTFLKKEFTKEDYANSRLAKQAGLALGSSISKDGDPETIRLIHDQWDEVRSRSKNKGEQRSRQNFLLKVMGNSKSDVFLTESTKAASSSDPALRSAAADSVRFAQSQDSRSLLFGLLNDDNPEVRTMVVQALRYQPFDERTKSALQNCTGDQDVGVKLNCYRVLSANKSQPGIQEYLSGRANAESDPQVNRTLQEALSSEGASSNH